MRKRRGEKEKGEDCEIRRMKEKENVKKKNNTKTEIMQKKRKEGKW